MTTKTVYGEAAPASAHAGVEDSTTAYLQSVGRFPLLTKEQEEQLGIDRETADRLAELGHPAPGTRATHEDAVAIAVAAYHDVLAGINYLGEWVHQPADLYAPAIRQMIDYEPDEAIVAEGVRRYGGAVEDVAARLVRLSQATRLLTPPVLEAMAKAVPCRPLAASVSDDKLALAARTYAAELAQRWAVLSARGQASSVTMVESNLRLVVSIARKYLGRGMPLLDLIQDGNAGLLQAVRRFDYRRGRKFSTYATWWIKQSVLRAIADRGRMIRLPVHRVDAVRRVERTRDRLLSASGMEPTPEEISADLGIEAEEAEELLRDAVPVMSLDVPILDDESGTIGDTVQSDEEHDLESRTIQSLLAAEVNAAVSTLPERERRIVELRYGLSGETPRTLADIGRIMGISRERARQLEERALRIMRRSPAFAQDLAR